jgi:hypothetical protein
MRKPHNTENHVSICMASEDTLCFWLEPFEDDPWAQLRAMAKNAETAELWNEFTRGVSTGIRLVLARLSGEHGTFPEHPAVDNEIYDSEKLLSDRQPNVHAIVDGREEYTGENVWADG